MYKSSAMLHLHNIKRSKRPPTLASLEDVGMCLVDGLSKLHIAC